MTLIDEKISQINWDFPESDTNDNIGSIHPYPAKFVGEIPRHLISLLGVPDGAWILDPFCGSGATLTEAQLAGIPSIGIDINPIACLISRVKTQPINGDLLVYATNVVDDSQNVQGVVVPSIPNLDHWFKTDIQNVTAKLLYVINSIDDNSIKESLQLALSSILVRVSNQESDTRYAAIDKNINPKKFYSLFLAAVERLEKIKANYQPKTWEAEILCNDILQVTCHDIKHPIGLVITSPPYPNAYEYWLYHKYRMFWLGYDPIRVKEQEIGARAHYFKKNPPTAVDFSRQMRQVLNLVYATLIRNGYACIVIGRSIVHGEVIDNARLISESAENTGFDVVANIPRTIAPSRKTFNLSHANIKTENILILKKK